MEPAVKPAAINTKTGAIGVLDTKGTFKGELYLRALHKFSSNAKVLEQVGEGLVEIVENGETGTEKARELIGKYVVPMMEQDVDHIVLGCTHYPFLEDVIKSFTGEKVTIVNPAPAIARRAGEVLSQRRVAIAAREGIIDNKNSTNLIANTFITTGDNIDVMVDIVQNIAPSDYGTFIFKKIVLISSNKME